MRFVFKMCVALLLLGIVAESQEPAPPLQPAVRPRRTRPPRAERVQPHTGDAWYPDPPPEGDANPSPPPQTYAPPSPGAVSTAGAVVAAPAAPPATAQPQSNDPLPPAAPAQVSFQNGQLTVRAINSTLESVLNAIRSKAGVQFEGLEGVGSERIAVSMGPLPEGEVLAAVLAGSRYDFVVMERPDSPGIVQRVILSPRKGSLPAGTQTSGMQPPRPAASEDDETPDEASAEPESPQDTPVHPPLLQAQPQQMQINPQPQQPQPGQTGPKTPEQLLEELKQMQQRQQQQQPPQQPAPQKPPP